MGYILVAIVAIGMLEYAKEEKNAGGALMGCFSILMLLGLGLKILEFMWNVAVAIWIPVVVIFAIIAFLILAKFLIDHYVGAKSAPCKELRGLLEEAENISDVKDIVIKEYGITIKEDESQEEVFFVDYHDKIQEQLNLIKHNEGRVMKIESEVSAVFQKYDSAFSKSLIEKTIAKYYAKRISFRTSKIHHTFDAIVFFYQEGQLKKVRYSWEEIIDCQKRYEELAESLKAKRLIRYKEEEKKYQQEEQRRRNEEIKKINLEREREIEEERRKEDIKRERAKLSASLRYDVLKRDNFRCAICGRSAEDGVTLHVDHIKPVSKGGKTEIDNLRTLCDYCNLGKSDKYDPDGIN